jgi:outer membrane protein OmpA-like peptidoglycan-associated protein
LARALQIRAYLISKGVNQLSINVQAMGNQVPSGDADRADIFIK